jgi:hypothetical protein
MTNTINLQNQYLAHAITQVNRKDAFEIFILSRRLQYLTASNSDDYESDNLVENLVDMNTTESVIKELQKLVK